MECYVCQASQGTEYRTREMMIGLRHASCYWECASCGAIQIVDAPEDLSIYYPSGYYSFASHFARWKPLLYWAHFHAPRLTSWLHRTPVDVAAVVDAHPQAGARILDVGCGGGRLVYLLRSVGFNACGIDPFLAHSGDWLRCINLAEVESGWDLILMNHSLEHMPDQRRVLEAARQKLAPGGRCIVRIPIAAWAWQNYRENWVQLDPPRHLLVHSVASFKLLTEQAGFVVEKTAFDSTEFQIWGSELYKNEIPLEDERANNHFTAAAMRAFKKKASALNAEGEGDQAVFRLAADPQGN